MSTDTMENKQFLLAFFKAKPNFKSTGLSGTNNHAKYKYAKIEDIYGAVESALGMEGIIIQHHVETLWPINTGTVDMVEVLHTKLIHIESGQCSPTDIRQLKSDKPGNQSMGAANTYMRKYAVLTLCAIASGEDDDCQEEQKYIDSRAVEKITTEQVAHIKQLIKSLPNEQRVVTYKYLLTEYKINDLDNIPAAEYEKVIKLIIN